MHTRSPWIHTLTRRSGRLWYNPYGQTAEAVTIQDAVKSKKKNTQFILFLQTWAELSFHPCPFILLPHIVIHVFPYPWWHLWLTGWCSPYLDEKRKNRTVKMHTSPCILQRGHAAAVLASVPVFAQMRWQASCGNYTPAALESIGTCALISWIKWEFVLTFLETLHW